MVYVVFLLIDLGDLLKNKKWKVIAVYSVLISTAYVFTVLNEMGVKLPSPAVPIKDLISSLFNIH
jgi:hypothetical protein